MTVGEVEGRIAKTRLNAPLEEGETSQDRIAKVGRLLEEHVAWVNSKMPPGSIPRHG